MKRLVLVALVAMGLALAPKAAQAAIVIDFGTGGAIAGGTYTLQAGGNATGVNIPIGSMQTDLNGVLGSFCVNGPSGTSNGLCTTLGGFGLSGVLNFNTATNTITVTGGIPQLGIAQGTVLLTGTFVSWTANANGLQGAIGPDTKSPLLLAALGLPLNTQFAYFGFSLTSSCTLTVGGACTQWNVISTDIKNTAVPEPGTMMLLGGGLLGLATIARRRIRKA